MFGELPFERQRRRDFWAAAIDGSPGCLVYVMVSSGWVKSAVKAGKAVLATWEETKCRLNLQGPRSLPLWGRSLSATGDD